jgi:uncharacterized protein YlzI (FlbEa/FlbD family)
MFQFFTRPDGKSIAINTDSVISVTESPDGVVLTLTNGNQTIDDNYLEVVAKLNQKTGCGSCR